MENAGDCTWWQRRWHGRDTRVTALGRVLCLALVLTQVGCRSVYRFHCTSRPMPAGVVVGEEMLGETPCEVKIAKDSECIQDGKVELTFCLPDGREKRHMVDLHDLKASSPLAEIVSAPLVFTGIGLFLLCGGDDEDEDDEDDPGMELLGLGIAGAGAGLFHVLGGDSDSLTPYDVHVHFDEPAGDSAEQQGGP